MQCARDHNRLVGERLRARIVTRRTDRNRPVARPIVGAALAAMDCLRIGAYQIERGLNPPMDSKQLDWDKMDGLLPAVVQDANTAEVLMLGYMNDDALAKTRSSGHVTFFSRSKQRLWTKGETSGNVLECVDIKSDCDGDALLVIAKPAGPTCHLQTQTCFGDDPVLSLSFLARLQALVERRKREKPAGSYTTALFAMGTRRIAQKVGEEGVETALAAATKDNDNLIDESADLLFHLLVLLSDRGLSLGAVLDRLAQRHEGNEEPT